MSTHHIFADPDNVNILEAAVTPPGEKCVCEESLVHILVVTQSIADISHRRRIENAKFWPMLAIMSQIYALFGVLLQAA